MNESKNFPKGHVHFESSESIPKTNSILIQENKPGCIHIHLGFLQYQHNYKIALDVPKEYFLGHCLNSLLKAAEASSPNVNCKLVSVKENGDKFHIAVEFFARKEKLLKEELNFNFEDTRIQLVFMARVLGIGKGTPLLKDEIQCIGAEIDEISESSDWAGFS